MSLEFNIDKLALLARIKLDPKEKKKFQKEFEAILNYVSKLKEISKEELRIKSASWRDELEIANVTREDIDYHQPGEFSEDLLKEAPCPGGVEKGYLKVKHILE